MANVLENVLTATPPSTPVIINALALLRLQNSRIVFAFPIIIPSFCPSNSPRQQRSHTNNTTRTNLPIRPRIGPPILEDGDLGVPRIRLEAVRDRSRGGPAGDFAQQRSLSVDCLCCVEGGETEAKGEGEKGTGSGEED